MTGRFLQEINGLLQKSMFLNAIYISDTSKRYNWLKIFYFVKILMCLRLLHSTSIYMFQFHILERNTVLTS